MMPPPRTCHCVHASEPIAFGIRSINLELLRLHVWGPGSTMHSTDDRAAVLWRLRARHTVTTCVLEALPVGALLTLQQDGDVVLQDTFPDVHLAVTRADALRARLEAKGWRPVPLENAERGRRRA